jgi:hypothetical protein
LKSFWFVFVEFSSDRLNEISKVGLRQLKTDGANVRPTTQKRKSNSNGYSGELAEPIYLPTALAHRVDPTGELEKAIKKRALSQLVSNLGELFKWHKVKIDTKDSWMHLALALAQSHVPGLQISSQRRPRRGPKSKWGTDLDAELLREVEARRSQKRLSIRDAIAELIQDKKGKFGDFSLVNLITRHRDARRADTQRQALLEKLSQSGTSSDPLFRVLGSPLENGDFNSWSK